MPAAPARPFSARSFPDVCRPLCFALDPRRSRGRRFSLRAPPEAPSAAGQGRAACAPPVSGAGGGQRQWECGGGRGTMPAAFSGQRPGRLLRLLLLLCLSLSGGSPAGKCRLVSRAGLGRAGGLSRRSRSPPHPLPDPRARRRGGLGRGGCGVGGTAWGLRPSKGPRWPPEHPRGEGAAAVCGL